MSQLLEVRGVCKAFPGVQALQSIDFTVRSGEVHALMGENGAGKSTLIKVLTGVHQRDQGTILLDGEKIHPRSPKEAEQIGISTVFQEINLIPHMSVAENICLGREPTRHGRIQWKALRERARRALSRLDMDMDVDRELCSCSVAIQQMIAIARAIDLDSRLLILDEPTSSLDEQEVDELFRVMERLRGEGMGLVFITHFLDQVYRISDRITVLRNGKLVGEFEASGLPRMELVARMLGRQVEEVRLMEQDSSLKEEHTPGEPVLVARNLGREGSIQPFDLEIREGEVVGLAGLLGSGRTEMARLFFGLDKATSGELRLGHKSFTHLDPGSAIEAGVSLCPEDRKQEGLILELSIRENIVLAMQASRGMANRLAVSRQKEIARHYMERLKIKAPSEETVVGNLSGGNQQKVLLAKWLAMSPRLILLDEPTRGIDVGAKAEVESLVSSLQKEGMAVLFISSELEEVVRTCQRIAVLCDRIKVGELAGKEISEDRIMRKIADCHE